MTRENGLTLAGMNRPRGVLLVAAAQAMITALVIAWFATGHSSAPDGGLQQLDLLSLHERVPGLNVTRPTMIISVSTCPAEARAAVARHGRSDGLPLRYGLRLLDPVRDADLVRALALGRSLARCQPGYALVDAAGFVRYRTYDAQLADHADEQRVLLGALS